MVDEQDEKDSGFYQESFGDFLKRHREASGKTLEAVSRTTRIPKRFLQAFEESDTKRFPEEAFTRGFLRSYAFEIGIEIEEVLSRYDRLKRSVMPTQIREVKKPSREFVELGEGFPVSRKSLGIGIVGIAVAFVLVAVLWSMRSPKSDKVSDALISETSPQVDSSNAIVGDAAQVIPSPSNILATPVTPSVLSVKASKRGRLSIRLDEHPAQEVEFSEGESRSFNVFKEVEVKTSDKAAFQFQYNSKPLEVSGPVIKLFNRHLFSTKDRK